MDSSQALVQASSRLTSTMSVPKGSVLQTNMVAQISALLYYKASVISKLTTNNNFQQAFSRVIFQQIEKDFGEYIDALARSKPRSLHHVYEWKQTGNKSARLFTLKKTEQTGLSFKLTVSYLPSKTSVPNGVSKRKHVFINKAEVMEAGNPLVIRPRNADRLVFQGDSGLVFMPKGKSVTVKRPGGSGVKNQFGLATSRFFNGSLINASIKRSGFQNLFSAKMSSVLKIPNSIKSVKYSFSPSNVGLEADAALTREFGAIL